MSPRFGHTMTLINKNKGQAKAVLFGGAKGLSYQYDLCNDCYIFKTEESTWVKLNPTGDIPCPRAAHAATCIDGTHLAIFGATGVNLDMHYMKKVNELQGKASLREKNRILQNDITQCFLEVEKYKEKELK